MCIAIVKPKEVEISKDILLTCSEANPDGMGFSFIDNGQMYIKKFMDFNSFYKEFCKHKNKSNMLIHFRIATHGKVELDNCHPFKLNNRMSLIHNGVISGYGDKEKKSDTKDFIDKVIGNISWKEWKNPSYRELVGKAIGYSKLAILDITGNYYIINENNGYWDNGIWYSNKSYTPKTKTTTTSTTTYYDPYGEDDYDTWCGKTFSSKKKCSDSCYYSEENKQTGKQNYKDDSLIYKCKNCGKEVVADYEDTYPVCEYCNSLNVEDVGFIYRNERYYYDDYNASKV